MEPRSLEERMKGQGRLGCRPKKGCLVGCGVLLLVFLVGLVGAALTGNLDESSSEAALSRTPGASLFSTSCLDDEGDANGRLDLLSASLSQDSTAKDYDAYFTWRGDSQRGTILFSVMATAAGQDRQLGYKVVDGIESAHYVYPWPLSGAELTKRVVGSVDSQADALHVTFPKESLDGLGSEVRLRAIITVDGFDSDSCQLHR